MKKRPLWYYLLFAAAIFAFAYYSPSVCVFWVARHYQLENNPAAMSELGQTVRGTRTMMLTMLLAVCAMGRLPRDHPSLNNPYLRWLRTTPWVASDKLPFRLPLKLMWYDLLWLSLSACILRVGTSISPLLALNIFLIAYLVFGSVGFVVSTPKWIVPLAFGFASLFRFWEHQGAVFAILTIMYCVYLRALQDSLDWCEWPPVKPPKREPLGWPFDSLGPVRPGEFPTFRWSAVTSSLIGWWLYCFFSVAWPSPLPHDQVAPVLGIEAGVLAFGRFLVYRAGHAPPLLNLRARIKTGRLVIPRHDQIYVAPFLVLLTAAGLCIWANGTNPAPNVAVGVGSTILIFLTLSLKPSRMRWHLTGEHRILPLISSAKRIKM